jgi:hypothetical protein
MQRCHTVCTQCTVSNALTMYFFDNEWCIVFIRKVAYTNETWKKHPNYMYRIVRFCYIVYNLLIIALLKCS